MGSCDWKIGPVIQKDSLALQDQGSPNRGEESERLVEEVHVGRFVRTLSGGVGDGQAVRNRQRRPRQRSRWRQLGRLLCSMCHGFAAIAGGGAPDLRTSPITLSPMAFAQVVQGGILQIRGMPRYAELSDADLNSLIHYLRARARESLAAANKPQRAIRKSESDRGRFTCASVVQLHGNHNHFCEGEKHADRIYGRALALE